MNLFRARIILILLVILCIGSYTQKTYSQVYNIDEVRQNLLANPPVIGDSSIRRNCFQSLDIILRSESASTDKNIKQFYNLMLENVANDISNPSDALLVIYTMYNHGFIVKMQDKTIAFDLIPGMPNWDMIPSSILKEIDIALVSHIHDDHFSSRILDSIIHYGKTVIIPAEIEYPGAISMKADDSIYIAGIKIKAFDGLHAVPTRMFEVTSPLGIKIMHTGDNQTSETLPENIKNLDILLLNSWVNESDGNFSNVTSMYYCLQKLQPKLMIPGHCNMLSHEPSMRYAYDSAYVLQERYDLTSEVRVMAWGEKTFYRPGAILPVTKTSLTPDIDGQWDSAWAFIPEYPMNKSVLEAPDSWFDLSGNFRAMWDEENLYFFIKVKDDILRTDNIDAGNNDGIEFFFDGDNSKNDAIAGYDENDLHMRFEYMGDAWHAENSEYAFYNTTFGYNFEVRIPLSDIPFDLVNDLIMGFDIQVTDNDQGTRNSILRWWSDNLDNWKWPGLFGTAKLLPSESKGIKTVPYSPSPVNIDGAMDNVWTGKPWMEMNQVITGEENLLSPDDLHILWNAVWDKNYLYFLFDLNDDILCTDNSEDYWSDDCIEFWIDGDNSKNYTPDEKNDFGFQFGYDTYSIIKTVKQVLGPIVELSCIKEAAQVTSDGLMIEVAFPLEELGIEPYDSTLFGIDIDYDDDDDGGDQDSKVKMFAQHDEDWLNPSDWGTFMLLGSGMIKNVPLLSPFNRLRESRCTISPNPVASMLNIDFEEITRDEKIEITISDIAGKTIYNNTCTSLSGRLNTSVDMSTIPNGIYLLAIKSNDYYTTEKIIKTD